MNAYQMNKLWWFLGLLGLSLIMVGSLMPSEPGPEWIPHLDKALHFTGYLMATYYFQQLTRNQKVTLIFIFIFSYSGLIEIIQGQLPSREMSLLDLVANGIGCLAGTFLSLKVFKELLLKIDQTLAGSKSR